MARDMRSLPRHGKRVVLIIPKPDPADLGGGDDKRLAGALDQLAALGWRLVAVVDPSRHLDALRMVLDGLAEHVVVTRPEDFPLVVQAADLGRARADSSKGARTQRILRRERDVHSVNTPGGPGGLHSPVEERTKLIDRSAARPRIPQPPAESGRTVAEFGQPLPDLEIRHATTDLAPEIAQAPARSGTNPGSEFGTPVPNPPARRRASERHSQVAMQDRRRRRA